VSILAADDAEHKEFLSGLIRLHILHHAVQGELYGQWMMEELRRHGYRISPGTLYPLLHTLQRKGYLKSRLQGVGRRARRLYRATKKGHKALHFAKDRVHELFGELFEGRRSGRRI
jgi:PadR family transcriptional regulator, regulatory protein PadR